jgi:cytochrome c
MSAGLSSIAVMSPVCGWSADAEAGKAVYTAKCRTCHGAEGQGNPGMAKVLQTEIKPLSSEEVQKLSDADMKKAITTGFGKMKPVAGIAGADLDNVVAYVRTMKK